MRGKLPRGVSPPSGHRSPSNWPSGNGWDELSGLLHFKQDFQGAERVTLFEDSGLDQHIGAIGQDHCDSHFAFFGQTGGVRPGFLRGAQQAEIDQGVTSQMQMLNYDADRSIDVLNQHLALIRGKLPDDGRESGLLGHVMHLFPCG